MSSCPPLQGASQGQVLFSTHFVNPLVLFSGVLWSWLLVTNENSMTASLLHKCDVMWFGTWQILLWMFTTSLLCDKVLLVSLTGGFAPAEHWGLGWLLRGLKWLHLVILNFVFSIFHKASPKKCFWLENKWKQNKTRRRRKVRVAQAKRRKCRDGERRDAWGQGIACQGKNAEDLSEKSIRWGWKGRVGFRKVELINSDNRL